MIGEVTDMSRKPLWAILITALGLFVSASVGPFPSAARAEGCFMEGWDEAPVCGIVQHCSLYYCHYHLYVESPPCRPSGSGPDCGMY